MSRYSVVGSAAECEPGLNGLVLRNRLGIKDPAVMEAVERDLLPDLLEAFESEQLARLTPFNPESMEELISGFAQVHVEFVLIHPFREGNGRIARLLIDVMACQAGIGPLDYSAWDQQREQYFAAIRAGAVLDMVPMAEQFRQVLPGSTADP
jgi:fido (protein-threonine AMPylation protein)